MYKDNGGGKELEAVIEITKILTELQLPEVIDDKETTKETPQKESKKKVKKV